MSESYSEFFQKVTTFEILPYQLRYGSDAFSPCLLEIPTGLGKSDAVLTPWLYAKGKGNPSPTRLILVLPRQNLTSQTAANARKRCEAAGLQNTIRVLELMAGSAENAEDLRPDQPAIIVATQDLYFSRTLNRGYARRAPRWPIDFALYNQDCLIVLDEIQLMDDALATSAQLDAFRKEFGIFGTAATVWMSATANHEWLRTIDFGDFPRVIRLEAEDYERKIVQERVHATKSLKRAPDTCRTPEGCAAFASGRHKAGTRTLIIANTVPRACQIYSGIRQQFPGAILLHSRFRPGDRSAASARLLGDAPPEGQIVVSTQVLEAGIDITARLLVTDIAPWGSLVQRFGRVNRYGNDDAAEIWWVHEPSYAKQKDPFAPYSSTEIEHALKRLANLESASPAGLPAEDGPEPWQHVLRRADLLDLFDTTPDLGGSDLDVSRFIRASDDKDVYLAWRNWDGDGVPPPEMSELVDAELCPVPIGDLREFAKKHRIYSWSFAMEEWSAIDPDQLYPGMLAVTRSEEGGYTAEEGWSPESKTAVAPLGTSENREEGDSSDRASFLKYRQTLKDHSDRVIEELKLLLSGCDLDSAYSAALLRAAQLHDWGKAHEVFQETMHRHDTSVDLLAKQCGNGRHSRKHFRHELASALAMIQTGESDLSAYLAAAHHGKIRMGIRAMPGEPQKEGEPRARGIIEGDRLPECEVASGVFCRAVDVSLAPMIFGAESGSWTERMLRLRDRLGPFRLAYLETLLRVADEQASRDPRLKESTCTN